MHIPDGFIDAKTAAITGALAATGLGIALRHASKTLPPQRVPLLGLSAAFVFAAQMLNFPVAAGTSGHLVGGVLTAAPLGPSAAVIVISAVLIVQCFVFADGGVTALGANIFNMALVAGVGGWAVYRLLSSVIPGLFGRLLAATFAGWCSTLLASIACAGQLAASGTVAWSTAFPAMAGVHMLIGIGEGVVTALVLSLVWTTRPELMNPDSHVPQAAGVHPRLPSLVPLLAYGLLISLGLALFVSPFASSSPDGLDKTAIALGFEEHAAAILPAPLPDYQFHVLGLSAIGTSIAGLIGTLIVFALAWFLARALTAKAPIPKP
jgi:cobalt/nickel transport system permease protein